MECLGLRFTDLAPWAQTASGALLLPLAGDDNFIVWFRREACATIVWGGNPNEHVIVHAQTGELSPRASFSAWRETVRGHCAPWRDRDLIAARLLRRTLDAELRRRAVDGVFVCDSSGDTGILETNSSQAVAIHAGLARQTRQDILDAVPDAMLVVDARSHIVLANSRAERCFRYAIGDLLGKHITAAIPGDINTLLSPGPVAPATDPNGRSASGPDLDITGVVERVGVREDGTAFPIEITVRQIDTLEGVLAIACIRDISARRAVEQQLAETELRSRSRFEAAPDSMVMVNGVGAITLMNRQAEIQFGYKRTELIGKDLTTIIVDGLSDPFSTTRDPSNSAVTDDTITYGLELSGRRKDGSLFPIDVQVGPLQNAEGIFVSAVIRDITARKAAEAELDQKVQELNRSNAELDKFAAIASHDLQEPLRMVASYTELLARRYKGRLDKDADDYIAYAVDGVRRMQQLIRDMLAYSRIAPPGTRLRTVSSEAALKQALLGLRAAIIQNRAIVTHDKLPMVVGDQMLLVQLFQNLVSNAIKYQRDPVPRVHVSAEPVGDSKYRFTVSDNGIGIEPKYFERIFGIFQRLHKREDYAGTGMGLAICKKIVEGHGGTISVSSTPGQGSTFAFTVQQPAQ